MPTLTRNQIAGHAATAGFTGEDLQIAVAVALAESGGDTHAHNSTPPDNSYGLMQINMLGAMGPDRRKRFKLSKNEDLFDPATNMRVAYGIWKEQGWQRGWTTYSRGTYKKFLGNATPTTDPGSGSSADSGAGSGDGITGAVNAFGSTVFKGLANLTGVFVAIALLVIGVLLLARHQVAKVIPAGKLKKVIK
jgi:hypothetical protein